MLPEKIKNSEIPLEVIALQKWGSEPWKQELAELVMRAHWENKLLLRKYDGELVEPLELMKDLCNGRFQWGVVNWELRNRPARLLDNAQRTNPPAL